jgi:hypothetical protein
MPRKRTFTQREITRAFRGMLAVDPNAHLVIDTMTRTFTIIPSEPQKNAGQAGGDTATGNPWDEVLTNAPHEKRPC